MSENTKALHQARMQVVERDTEIAELRTQLAEAKEQLEAKREAAKGWHNIAQHLYYALGAIKYPLNNLVNGYKGEFEQHYKLKCALVDEALEMAKKFEQNLEDANRAQPKESK